MTRLTSTERYMIIAVTIVTVIILGIMFLMGISTSNDVPAVSQKEREAFEQQMNRQQLIGRKNLLPKRNLIKVKSRYIHWAKK